MPPAPSASPKAYRHLGPEDRAAGRVQCDRDLPPLPQPVTCCPTSALEGHQLLAEYFRAVDPALPPLERLREMGRAYHRFGLEHPNYCELKFLHRLQEPLQRECLSDVCVPSLAHHPERRIRSKAPWYDIPDDLPRHEAYPAGPYPPPSRAVRT